MKKIAIIGASLGQMKLCEKAREMGLFSIGFAWPEGAVCQNLVDRFYPISIIEREKIVEICKEEEVQGVVSNASDLTAEVVAYVSEKLGLHGNAYKNLLLIKDKSYVRSVVRDIEGLHCVDYYIYNGYSPKRYPCVVKPTIGAAKKGVSFVANIQDFRNAIKYAQVKSDDKILIESYIEGREISIESISFEGQHFVIQITDKDGTGAPHFVELGHHQPASLTKNLQEKVKSVVPKILDKVHYMNGASHIEMKIDNNNELFLIEINPRGGGGEISNQLVFLSTGFDYVKAMINVSLGDFKMPKENSFIDFSYAGIYFLCGQTESYLPFFKSKNPFTWLYEKKVSSLVLNNSVSNYDRNGFLIYRWWRKVDLLKVNYELISLNAVENNREMAISFLYQMRKETASYDLSVKWIDKILKYADIYAIIVNGAIVAWIVLYCNDYETRVAYCAGLYVLQDYRRKYLAQNLLNTAIYICKQRKFKELTLYCNNPIAESLYLKNGFVLVRKEIVETLKNREYNLLKLTL